MPGLIGGGGFAGGEDGGGGKGGSVGRGSWILFISVPVKILQ